MGFLIPGTRTDIAAMTCLRQCETDLGIPTGTALSQTQEYPDVRWAVTASQALCTLEKASRLQ